MGHRQLTEPGVAFGHALQRTNCPWCFAHWQVRVKAVVQYWDLHDGMQEDLQKLQVQLMQRQLAEPGLALSPALLYGDLTLWAGDPHMLGLLTDVANGKGRVDSNQARISESVRVFVGYLKGICNGICYCHTSTSRISNMTMGETPSPVINPKAVDNHKSMTGRRFNIGMNLVRVMHYQLNFSSFLVLLKLNLSMQCRPRSWL